MEESSPCVPNSHNALAACRGAFLATFLFSGMSNILMLTGPESFFVLEVYDRVLPSRSLPTLVVLLVLAGGLYAALGILDMIRSRILVRIAHSLDEAVGERVYNSLVHIPLVTGNQGDGIQPLRDLDAIRSFLSGVGPIALFDLPWMPFYLRDLFRLSFLHRPDGAGRCHHPGHSDHPDRSLHAASDAGGVRDVSVLAIRLPKRAAAMPKCWSPWA